MVLKKHKCPNCNKSINFSEMFLKKNDLEYYCESCHEVSYIKMDRRINNLVFALIVACVLIVLIFSFIVRMLIVGTFIMLLLFLGFYLLVPNFLELTSSERKQK